LREIQSGGHSPWGDESTILLALPHQKIIVARGEGEVGSKIEFRV